MKKIFFTLVLIGSIIPSIGWAKEWVLWFPVPFCNGIWGGWPLKPAKPGIICKRELWIYKHSEEESDLKIRFIARNEKPFPKKKGYERFYTDWFIQSEKEAVYILENFFGFSDFSAFRILEVRIISKNLPTAILRLKDPFGENFEVFDLDGNPLTYEGPNGEIIIPNDTISFLPILKN